MLLMMDAVNYISKYFCGICIEIEGTDHSKPHIDIQISQNNNNNKYKHNIDNIKKYGFKSFELLIK